MKFKELNENLNKVLMKLIESNDLCKLIHYTNNNPLNQPNLSENSSLLFSKIFPYPFNIEILQSASNIINVTFDNFELGRNNTSYKNGIVTFTVICHHELWKIEGGLRPFFIAEKIDELFNGERVIGIGTMQFDRMQMVWASKDYSGYRISYKVVEFN